MKLMKGIIESKTWNSMPIFFRNTLYPQGNRKMMQLQYQKVAFVTTPPNARAARQDRAQARYHGSRILNGIRRLQQKIMHRVCIQQDACRRFVSEAKNYCRIRYSEILQIFQSFNEIKSSPLKIMFHVIHRIVCCGVNLFNRCKKLN